MNQLKFLFAICASRLPETRDIDRKGSCPTCEEQVMWISAPNSNGNRKHLRLGRVLACNCLGFLLVTDGG